MHTPIEQDEIAAICDEHFPRDVVCEGMPSAQAMQNQLAYSDARRQAIEDISKTIDRRIKERMK